MSMALPQGAAMLEYALTKGLPGRPAKIVVRLNNTTVLTLTRTSVEVGVDLCTWHGTVDGTDAPATIIWMSTETANSPQADVVINVIVAYTQKAASHYTDLNRELVAFSIELANQSFRNSKLGHIKLHAYQTDYVEEGQHFDHLWRFADKNDGYLDEIHPLREKYDADVAVLVVDDPTGCGLATRVFADADEAFAVAHHACALMS